jgi:hypothetical protein
MYCVSWLSFALCFFFVVVGRDVCLVDGTLVTRVPVASVCVDYILGAELGAML